MSRHVLTALWATLMVMLLAGCTQPFVRASTVPQKRAVTPRPPVVMIVGDSFTVGSGPVRRWQAYPALAARRLGWQLITAGAGGTGFVNPGKAGRTFQQSFIEELAWRPAPDMLIISGGHNDRRVPPARVGRAAKRLIETVRARWPTTRIVVIGPIWLSPPPRWAHRVRDAIAAAALGAGVTFLDPLNRRDIGARKAVLPDGIHPTHRGHARLADWLVESLGGAASGKHELLPATASPDTSATVHRP